MKQMMNESLNQLNFLMFDYSRVLFLNFSYLFISFHITLFHESNTKKAPFLPVPSNNKKLICGKLRTTLYKGCLLNQGSQQIFKQEVITDKVGGSSAKPEVSKQTKEKRLKHKVSGYKSQSKRRSIAGCRLLLRTL